MHRRRGFTLIELLITITIMVVLLVLAVVSLRGSQAAARDKAREAQAQSIAVYMENLYDTGFTSSDGSLVVPKGQYPPAGMIANSCTNNCTTASSDYSTNTAKLEDLFDRNGFDLKTLKAPGQTTYGLVVAKNAQPSSGGLNPAPSIDTFVYQPIMYNGSAGTSTGLCNLSGSDCRSFNLYYVTEADNTIHTITSKHQ